MDGKQEKLRMSDYIDPHDITRKLEPIKRSSNEEIVVRELRSLAELLRAAEVTRAQLRKRGVAI